MDYGGIKIATIKGMCSEASFDRGRQYYLEGMVRSARMSRGAIEATVSGTSRYTVRVTGGSGDLECRCTCPYDYGGYCKHIVSVLLHARDNARGMREDEAGRRGEIVGALDAATGDQIREFLAQEMEDSEELLDRFTAAFGIRQGCHRADYRAMAESVYEESADGYHGQVPYGYEIDFGRITKLARSHKDRRDYEEAIRAYRELSEVIAKNMDMVDDSDGYYGECFSDVIRGMAECINGRGVAKERHITYVFERFMRGEPDYFTDYYEDALDAICTGSDDLAHWGRLLDPHVPDKIPDGDNWSEHYEAVRLIMMKIVILERTGSDMLADMLAKHYRDDHNICIAYITHLKKRDRQAALRIAEEGVRMFPHIKVVGDVLHGMYKKTDPGFTKSLRRIFLRDGSWRHYDELKGMSRGWDGELELIIRELERRRDPNLLIGVLLREQMADRALRLILQCDSLRVLEEHHGKVCSLYPGEYHAAYRRHIDRLAKGARSRDGYRQVKEHLKAMKAVPGHRKEFGEFVRHLRERHARQPAFLDEIKRI